jgi:peptidyl-prolyl cis-trans isomerase B (cyclophilin B)
MKAGLGLAAVTLLVACGGNPDPSFTVEACEVEVTDPSRARDIAPLAKGKNYRIAFQTSHGNFTLELDENRAPCNGDSLMQLARDGFYDGVAIHRVVPGFVIQLGHSPRTAGGGPGYTTIDPPLPETQFTKGVVGMAKTEVDPPGTGGSEFFIVTADDSMLPADYAPVGRIVAGMDVIEKIGRLGNPETEQPTEKIVVKGTKVSVGDQ